MFTKRIIATVGGVAVVGAAALVGTPANAATADATATVTTPVYETTAAAQGWSAVAAAGRPGSLTWLAEGVRLSTVLAPGATDAKITFGRAVADLPLAELDDLSYSITHEQDGSIADQRVAINLGVDVNGAAEGGFTTLIFEPVYNAERPLAAVQTTYDAVRGGDAVWWSSNSIPGHQDRSFPYPTLATLVAANPDAVIRSVAVNQGGGNNGLVDVVHQLTFDGNAYAFHAGAPAPVDTTAPTVTSVKQQYETREGGRIAVTLTFDEAVVSMPQGWAIASDGLSATKRYYRSGPETTTFTDAAGNSGSTTFTVDKSAPTVTGVAQRYEPDQGGRIAVTLTFDEPVVSMPQGWAIASGGLSATKRYYSSGTETTTFADAVGNPGTTTFVVDKTAPTVTGVTQRYETRESGRIAVTLTFDERVTSMPQGWAIASDGLSATKRYYRSGSETTTFTDAVGNPGTTTFVVDKTAPAVTGTTQKYESKEGGRVAVTVTFDEPIVASSVAQGWAVAADGLSATKRFYKAQTATITYTDAIGNPGTSDIAVKSPSSVEAAELVAAKASVISYVVSLVRGFLAAW